MINDADRRQLDEIAFVLAERTKPTLVLISVGSYRKRNELRFELDRLVADSRAALLDLSGHSITSLFRAVREGAPTEVLTSQPGEYLLHVYGIEDSLLVAHDGKIAATSLIEELNLERENLYHQFPCSLVLWTTAHFVEKLRRDAADLWDWITYRYHFADDECHEGEKNDFPTPLDIPSGITEERKQRIAELEERLQGVPLDGDQPERMIRSKLVLQKILGTEYLAAYRPIDAIRCYTAALALLGQTRHEKIEAAEIHFRLGTAHLSACYFSEALAAYRQSLHIQTDLGVDQNIGGTWHQIGIVYRMQRDWAQALESYGKALKLFEKTGEHFGLGITWHQVGIVYQMQRDWAQALESYGKALEWKEKTGHYELGSTWHQIGRLYQEQREWVQAIESYGKALEWDEKNGQQHQLGSTWHQIGRIYQEQREWTQALQSYGKALEWKEKTGQHHELGSTWHQIGIVHEKQTDYGKALHCYLRALELLVEYGSQGGKIVLSSLRRISPHLPAEDRQGLDALPEWLSTITKEERG